MMVGYNSSARSRCSSDQEAYSGGTRKREFPKHQGHKLKQIRLKLEIETYDEMIVRLARLPGY